MSEFIGSRISLISKSDIRYVGVLYEINSESSTVALEQVKSFGTEGRRDNPDEEIPGSDSVYEYIVFRGSDVKDLKIEEAPKENKAPPSQVPNDPAILGSGSRPPAQPNQSQALFAQQGVEASRLNQTSPHSQQSFPLYQQYNQFQNQRFKGPQVPQLGFGGPPNGYQGYPGMAYNVPPSWYPLPGQGYPQPPGPFSPHHPHHQLPIAFNGQRPSPGPHLAGGRHTPPVTGNENSKGEVPLHTPELQASTTQLSSNSQVEGPADNAPRNGIPRPPKTSKQDRSEISDPQVAVAHPPASDGTQKATDTLKNKKIIPTVPTTTNSSRGGTNVNTATLQSTNQTGGAQSGTLNASRATADVTTQYQNATLAATAAVAAAMAKLPPAPVQKSKIADIDNVDNLTKKVHDLRTDDKIHHSGKPGLGGYAAGHRGGRGGRRVAHQNKGLEVPSTDFDFESANAKFNKRELVKEAVGSSSSANSETVAPTDRDHNENKGSGTGVVIPPITETYSKSSFFDNISSEAKDREIAGEGKKRGGGLEFRHEERKRNLETFGMGSVESGGYRGGYRGRGGRGRVSRGGIQRGNGGRSGTGFRSTRRGDLASANAVTGSASAEG